jgi:cytidyltransferase-like protein
MSVIYPGTFDIFHYGHVRAIQAAAQIAYTHHNSLWVAVQSDCSVFDEKRRYPANSVQHRMEVVEAVRGVDRAISYKNRNLSGLLKHVSACGSTILVVSEEYGTNAYSNHEAHLKTLEFCTEREIPVIRLPRTPGISGSALQLRNEVERFWRGSKRPTLTSFNGDQTKLQAETDLEVSLMTPFVKPDSLVLDLGAGMGRHAVPLAKLAARVIAVEASPGYFRELQSVHLNSVQRDAIQYVCTDCQPASFDIVNASGLVTSFDDAQLTAFAGGVTQTLKSGGYLFLRATIPSFDFSVIRQWSDELADFYTAHYREWRTLRKYFDAFELVQETELYRNQPETSMKMFILRKK